MQITLLQVLATIELEALPEQIPLLLKVGSILSMEEDRHLVLDLDSPVKGVGENLIQISYTLHGNVGGGYRENCTGTTTAKPFL